MMVGQPGPRGGATEQIGEQVRRDVERALREAGQNGNVDDATRAALEQAAARLGAEAGRIEATRAEAEANVARGRPEMAPRPPGLPRGVGVLRGPDGRPVFSTGVGQASPFGSNDIPQGAVDISIAFFVMIAVTFIGTPLARAFARRMDRKPVPAPAAGGEVVARLDRIEQAVDAIALEVERVSEGQRYVTKLMAEPRALASPNDAGAAEMAAVERGLAQRAAAVSAERGT
jgi:Arc/MetJ-type ribon-helix-helix transcriptional regulator